MKNKLKKVLFGLSLCVVLGVSTNVIAAVTVTDSLPETVTRKMGYRFLGTELTENTESKVYYAYSNDDKYQLFCSDAKNETVAEGELKKGNRMDYGIAYILKNAYPTSSKISDVKGGEFKNSQYNLVTDDNPNIMANTWITQTAIWGLQGSITKDITSVSEFSYSLDNDTAITLFTEYTDDNTNTILTAKALWDNYSKPLITAAKSVKDPAETTMSATMSGKWTDSGNYKKSGLITVATSNTEAAYSNYAISLVNAPTGVKVITEAGAEVSDLNNIPAGTKIYVLVPNASAGKTFTLKASTTVTYDAAYQYVSESGLQPSVLVGPENKEIATELTIVPDTASSISTSIYFIGFVILLSGAGIIYANIKPRKQESE